ncbi:unnamed protein product, partial [Vitis vinifera]
MASNIFSQAIECTTSMHMNELFVSRTERSVFSSDSGWAIISVSFVLQQLRHHICNITLLLFFINEFKHWHCHVLISGYKLHPYPIAHLSKLLMMKELDVE